METIRQRIKTLRRIFQDQYGAHWYVTIKNNIERKTVTFVISNCYHEHGVIVEYDKMINYSIIDLINYIDQFLNF